MQFTRPFRGADLHYFAKAADLGFDFVELLVPEPEDGLDLAETRRAAEDAGIFLVLAARVNPSRSIASEDAANRQGGLDYLKHCVEVADRIGARIIGGPLYGEPWSLPVARRCRARTRTSPPAPNARSPA